MRRLDRPSSRRAARAALASGALASAALAACQDAPLGPAPAAPPLGAPSLDVQAASSARPLVWYLRTDDGFEAPSLGVEGDVPVPADYDGDGVTDPAVFQPATGTWRIMRSGWQDTYDAFFGQAGDVPLPADYDGDGLTDLAVFRPSTERWWIFPSQTAVPYAMAFGDATDRFVPGDYTGDGKADLAVYRNGAWWTRDAATGAVSVVNFGLASDVVVPADYDGDGRTDRAVFRNGQWWIMSSGTGAVSLRTWGTTGDVPVPADYDGDGSADAAIFRPSTGAWWIFGTTAGQMQGTWGLGTDTPVPGDYQGTGAAQLATVRVGPAAQVVTFTSTPPAEAAIGTTYEVAATGGGSGNPVVFSSLTPATCTVSGSTVSFVATGECVVAANQAGSADYEPAPQATQSIAVVWPFAWASPTLPPPSLNVGSANSTVKAWFDVGADRGLAILDGTPRSAPVSCADPSTPPAAGSFTPIKASGPLLTYDASSGRYAISWKTEKSWKNGCRWLEVKLDDGSTHAAVFQFR